ncbi:MAG: PLP-dependent transferase [Desulfobacterales bacterium]|jgi:cystathionine gamma-synthase
MTKRKTETIAVRAGRDFDTQIGAVMPPIHLTTTFIRGNAGEFIYSRVGNPNRQALEECLTDLEGGAGAIAFGSGTGCAAIAQMPLRWPRLWSTIRMYTRCIILA